MPVRIQDNTKYHPLTIKDMLFRNGNFATTSFMPDEIVTEINNEWIYYLCQASQYMGNDSDLLSTYIFQNYSERHLLDKYADWFEGWNESTDYPIYEQMIIDTIHRTLIANIEKYNKLYYTMTAEFNPLWNVDGTEVIERTLDQMQMLKPEMIPMFVPVMKLMKSQEQKRIQEPVQNQTLSQEVKQEQLHVQLLIHQHSMMQKKKPHHHHY